MRRLFTVGFVALLLTASQVASPANARGGIVPPPKTPVSVEGERAIVSWNGDKESMTMMLNMLSASKQTGIVIPTPAPAVVTHGDRASFDLLEKSIVPTVHVADDWWGISRFGRADMDNSISVLRRVSLGPLSVTTLEASDSAGLSAWLTKNDFVIAPKMTAALANYVALGWSFTAIKLSSDQSLDGTVDPVTLTFKTDRLVYPMALAALATTPQELRLYILDKQRDSVVEQNTPTIDFPGDVTVLWSGQVLNPALRKFGTTLTVINMKFDDPKNQVADDIGIIRSADASEIQPRTQHYRIVSLLGVPAGTLIVAWILFGIVVIIVFVRYRRRYS